MIYRSVINDQKTVVLFLKYFNVDFWILCIKTSDIQFKLI